MFPDPPNDGRRTVFCRDCGEWRHPRHACARDPDHATAPLPVLRLRRDGPAPPSDLGTGSRINPESRRQHAVGKFDPQSNADGPVSTFGATTPVYYLTEEHDPADVIERWLSVNEETLLERGLTTENVTRALSKDRFERAWQKLRETREFAVLDAPEYGDRGGGDRSGKTACPFCGASIEQLPAHLPCDGVETGE